MAASSPRSSLLTLFSIVAIDLIGFGVVIPILPYLAESYGASATVLGVLLTSYAAMQLVFAPIWGRISDRIGRRPVMMLTIAGTAVALIGLGLADSLLWLFVARIFGGIFSANISVATAYVADLTEPAERTKWMGMIGVSFAIGFVLGPALGGTLAPFGYHVPMLTAGGLALVNLIYASFVLREPPTHRREEAAVETLQLPPEGTVRKLCLAYFVFSFAVSQLETVFAFYMKDRFDYEARGVAYILVLMAVVMATVQGGAIRHLAKRFGERNLLLGGTALLAIAFSGVPLASTVAVLLVPLMVSSVGRAVCHPSLLTLVSSAARADNRGAVMGAFQSSASFARVVGPLVAGSLYDRHHTWPFWVAGALMLVVFAIATTVSGPIPTIEG